jgi:hypothetical protein
MDSDLIFETYQRYKSGTKKVINWLFESAGKSRYKLPEAHVTIEHQKRKKHKNGFGKRATQTSQATFTLAVGQYPALARAIATSEKPAIKIEQILFAIYCFFKDFHSTCRWLQKLWTCYKSEDGVIDLATIATITQHCL